MWWRYTVSLRDVDNLSLLEESISKVRADGSFGQEINLLPEYLGRFALESHEDEEAYPFREDHKGIHITV